MAFKFITGSIAQFTSSFKIPLNGQLATGEAFEFGYQALADRTAFLSSSLFTVSSALDSRITSLSSSVAFDINAVSSSNNTISASVATDIDTLESEVTALSSSVATDVNTLESNLNTVSSSFSLAERNLVRSQVIRPVSSSRGPFGTTPRCCAADQTTYAFVIGRSTSYVRSNYAIEFSSISTAGGYGGSFYGGAFHNGKRYYMFCGTSEEIQISSDKGNNWQQDNTGGTQVLIDIAGDENTSAVAVGAGQTILYNSNILTSSWTAHTADTFGGAFNGVTYSGGYYIAVGSSGEIQRDLAGTDNWTTIANASGFSGVFRGADADGNGNVVIVGDGGEIQFSSDNGANWTDVSIPDFDGAIDLQQVKHIKKYGVWLAAGDRGTIVSSLDGQTWAVTPHTEAINVTFDDFCIEANAVTFINTNGWYWRAHYVA